MVALNSHWVDDVVAAVDRADVTFATIAALLADAIPCDEAFYVEIDFVLSRVVMIDELAETITENADCLIREERTHPLGVSYLEDSEDRTPRRMSDVVGQRRSEATEAYASVFRSIGARYQLGLITSLHAPVLGRGWTLARSLNDFSDRDLELATVLLPLVAVLTTRVLREGRGTAPPRVLTERERTVLDRVSRGWTSTRIAFELSISERTVQKHLEHAYRKMDVGDRLSAVRRATDLRLI